MCIRTMQTHQCTCEVTYYIGAGWPDRINACASVAMPPTLTRALGSRYSRLPQRRTTAAQLNFRTDDESTMITGTSLNSSSSHQYSRHHLRPLWKLATVKESIVIFSTSKIFYHTFSVHMHREYDIVKKML